MINPAGLLRRIAFALSLLWLLLAGLLVLPPRANLVLVVGLSCWPWPERRLVLARPRCGCRRWRPLSA
jgi:hypothetical protein